MTLITIKIKIFIMLKFLKLTQDVTQPSITQLPMDQNSPTDRSDRPRAPTM